MSYFGASSSRDKNKNALWLILIALCIVLYLLLFPRALGKDSFLVPVKAVSMTSLPPESTTAYDKLFLVGQNTVALTKDGVPVFFRPARTLEAVSGVNDAWYDETSDQTEVSSASGPLFHLPGKQYPYWLGQRFYTFSNDRLGLTEYDLKGNRLWSKDRTSIITAVAAGPTLRVVGSLDGRITVYDKTGAMRGSFNPGGSQYPVIYNTAISPDEKHILLLSGMSPKRFLVLERGTNEFHPVFHQELSDQKPYPTPLGFLGGDRWAYFVSQQDLHLLNLKTDHEAVMPLQGQLKSLIYNTPLGLITSVTGGGSASILHVWSTSGRPLLFSPFQAQHVLLFQEGNRVILVADQTVLIMKRELQ